jgi:hypothetical protein
MEICPHNHQGFLLGKLFDECAKDRGRVGKRNHEAKGIIVNNVKSSHDFCHTS